MAIKKETIKIILEVLQDKIAMMETSVNLNDHKDDLSVISAFNSKAATPSTLLEQLENVPEAFRSVIMTRMDSVVQNIKKTQIYYDALDDILANTGDETSTSAKSEEKKPTPAVESKPIEAPKAAETPKVTTESKPAETPVPVEKPTTITDKHDSELSRDAKSTFVNHYSAELERKYVGLLFDKDGYLRFPGVASKRYFRDEKTDSLRDTVTSKKLSVCRIIGGNSFYYWRFGGIIVPVPTTMWIGVGKAEIDHLKKTREYYYMASAMCEKLPEIIKQLEELVEAERKAAEEATAKKAPTKVEKPAAAPTESKAVKPTTTPNVEETFQLPLPTANADERQIPLDWDSSVPKDRYYVSSLGYVYDMIAKKKLEGEQIRLLTNSGKGKTINLKKIVYNAFNPSSRMCGYLRIFTRDGNESNCAIDNLYIARAK
jgi:hypothetical protein